MALTKRNLDSRLGRNSLLKVVKHRYKLPKEVVDAPSLDVYNSRLDGALGSLSCWGRQPAHSSELELYGL